MKLEGLSRQIALSMATMAFSVTLLVVLTAYVFYYLMFRYWPDNFNEPGLVPTAPEWLWLLSTTLVGLVMAIVMGANLARRILVPLNSVADAIRLVAQGDLAARANAGDRSLHEAALLADDFNALAGQLQRVTEEQTFWNAAIAHELRTPVTILRGRLQGLAEAVFTPDASQFQSLLTQVESLGRLIEDLRVISLAESGHLDLQIQEADLANDVRAIVEVFGASLQAAGQHPLLNLHEQRMRCDPVRIRQALLALLENARRHAVPGAIRVQTCVEQGMCCLRVEDEGPGISPSFAPHVFEAFRRADNKRSSGGSGLGLAVVAAIARAHGGEAICRPSSRSGTLFELRWPADFATTTRQNSEF
ncbi:two-component sensor histidine kinase [Paraburkholderia steynii]|uniref:histidine kinase n=1 Tax=Paraburkholderia steynii TaxID=1245441 RepID=A0A4R0XCB3_9BURK|nr:two-component sensor histidine kinase [Paraburkholderia steynii]